MKDFSFDFNFFCNFKTMKNNLLYILFILTAFSGFCQKKTSQFNGKSIDTVVVKNTSDETFSIYFPEKYNSAIPAAVVFIFEPVARGKVGLEPFMLASETYNYILVCSNNARNGSLQYNKEVANRLFDAVLSEYNIDISQLYLAGFSGGSRLAGSIALQTGAFQGVIACGASFQPFDRFIPPANQFSYVGLVGKNDMNFQEMIKNKAWLNKSAIKNELFISNDGHVWPETTQILRAFDWLELQAYKKNIRKSNDTIIKKIYAKNLKIADSLKNNNQPILAINEYERIYNNFNVKYVDENLKTTISELKKSKEYKQDLKTSEEIAIEEESISVAFSAKFDEELKSIKSNNDFKYWKKLMNLLDAKYSKAEENDTREMVTRLKYKIRAMVYEGGEDFKRLGENAKYLYCKELRKFLGEVSN